MARRANSADEDLADVLAATRLHGGGVYIGHGFGPLYAPPQHSVLVLGPPRSGKTSSIVIPNVIGADGAVLVASTKQDVFDATAGGRSRLGRVAVFDPSGETRIPRGSDRVGWSPVTHAAKWDRAVLCADAMVGASRGGARGDQVHWNERASALLAPLLHAAAIDGASMTDVVRSVNRRDPSEFVAVLTRREAVLPLDTLIGILETDERERSGIFSTASSVLAAYRTEAALESASLSPLDTAGFLADRNTCFVLGSGEHQRHLAPLIAGLVSDIRHDAYAHTAAGGTHRSALLVLDELANIAPLEDLPSLVSEGSSQGLVTLACLQDLSQARARWGEAADGFLSLFGTKVVLPGIGDRRTLEALSILSGDRDVQTLSVGGNRRRSRRTWTRSTRQERHIPPDVIANGPPGSAIVAVGAGLRRVALTPAHTTAPFDRLITLDTSGHADDVGASIAIERNGQPRATGRSRSHDPRTR